MNLLAEVLGAFIFLSFKNDFISFCFESSFFCFESSFLRASEIDEKVGRFENSKAFLSGSITPSRVRVISPLNA